MTRIVQIIWAAVALLPLPAAAGTSTPAGQVVPPERLAEPLEEEVLVVGARMPRRMDTVVGKVDVIAHEKLVDEMANTLSDVVRYLPGVSVVTADSRFGETELTIRGLSGNRVATLIDGIPVPDQFDIGSFANAGQDFLVVDAISRVEILRGPASTLFGNDALGGVFAVVTRDPEEFLRGRPLAAGANASWLGRDDSITLNGSVAAGGHVGESTLNGVLFVSHKDGHETDRAAVEGNPDRQDRSQQSIFAKSAWITPSGNRLHLELSLFEEDVATDMVSVLGYGRQFGNTTSLAGDDTRDRQAVTAGYDFEAGQTWIDHGRVNAYWQRVQVDQRTTELRAPLDVLNQRRFRYETESTGFMLDFDSGFTTGPADHRLAWGLDLAHSTIGERRDGFTEDLSTGTRSSRMLGEVMPVRDFPRSTVDEAALYLHDELTVGRLTVIPGLRWESYRLNARPDPIYVEDNPTTDVVDAQESTLSPKLGAIWRFSDRIQAYGQYAHGFRAPPFEDLNIGLDIALFNYRAIPNPDLEPETSDGIELGFRYMAGGVRFSAAVFGTDYDNLIETKANLGFDENGTLIFQSRNIDHARVYGAELSLSASLERWIPGVALNVSSSITRGTNRTTDEPLNTVNPAELVAMLSWAPSPRLRLALNVTAVAAKDDVSESVTNQMTTDGYVVTDLTGSFRVTDRVRLEAGLFNAFDETYWQWGAVRNRTTDDPMIDYLSAPGRYASVAFRATL
jgi:hemoglobin/transferrin/lactoferrin receptor protein